jgi:deazaflavin-dependent oxidoreductase (nitroreductase family)
VPGMSSYDPARPTPTMDLSVLDDASWLYDQSQLLATVDAAGTTDSISVTTGGTTTRRIILVTRGAKSGETRRTPLVRIEYDGRYLLVASKGGAAKNPAWYHNIKAHPDVQIQDGTATVNYFAREIALDERAAWWSRAVKEWAFFAEYQQKTPRLIPLLELTPVD